MGPLSGHQRDELCGDGSFRPASLRKAPPEGLTGCYSRHAELPVDALDGRQDPGSCVPAPLPSCDGRSMRRALGSAPHVGAQDGTGLGGMALGATCLGCRELPPGELRRGGVSTPEGAEPGVGSLIPKRDGEAGEDPFRGN